MPACITPSMICRQKKALAWYAAAQLLVLIFFYWPWLTGNADFYFRDATHYFEPLARFVAGECRHFRLPLWNPWYFIGMSQASLSIVNVFYPPTWLFVLLPYSAAVAATMVLHQLLCGVGGFLLVECLGWGVWPAAICGITLSMSGYMFSLISNFPLVSTASWCPISLWAIYLIGQQTEAVQTCQAKALVVPAAIATICLSLLIMAGQPELAAGHLAFLLFYSIVAAFVGWRAASSSDARDSAWQLVLQWRLRALGLAVLLAMPVILPSYEWLELSRRAGGLLAAETLLLSANWYDMLNFVLPQPLGDLQLRYAHFRPLVMSGQLVPYVSAPFVGPIVVTLAFWGAADRTFKYRWLIVAVLLIMLLLSLGANAPLTPAILAAFPSVSLIRFPIKLLFFAIWCLALLSARGLYAFAAGNAGTKAPLFFWLSLLGLALIMLSGSNLADWLLGSSRMSPALQLLARQAEPLLGRAALLWGSVGLASAALGHRLHTEKRNASPALVKGFVAATAVVLLYYGAAFCHAGAAAGFFRQPSYVEAQLEQLRSEDGADKNSRSIALYFERFSIPHEYAGSEPFQATINMYQYSRQLLRPNTNIDFSERSAFGFEGTSTGDYYYFLLNSYLKSSQAFDAPRSPANDQSLARFCQLTATKYVLTQCYRFADNGSQTPVPLLNGAYFELARASDAMNVRIYRLKTTLPRAYFSDCWQWVPLRDDALQSMFSPEKSSFDPLKTTILEPPGSNRAITSTLESSPVLIPRSMSSSMHLNSAAVKIIEDTDNDITLQVDAPVRGYLILADQYYPGWSAQIDGAAADILPANVFTRAVAVGPGQHTLRFSYRPGGVILGVVIAGLAMFLLGLSCLRLRRKHN